MVGGRGFPVMADGYSLVKERVAGGEKKCGLHYKCKCCALLGHAMRIFRHF